ncbi:MAG: methylenetetrahydrofolate reductase [Dehalococcoidia bacterium]|nr:methylenetetrahydrofolate reductase [Dehalococcoidia bacterium]
MSFAAVLAAGAFPVALEITPPQKVLPAVLLRRARLLGDAASAVNVIQRPGRQPSLEASIALQAAGVAPTWHLVTRGRSRGEIVSDLQRASAAGLSQVLCIRGDHHAADPPDVISLREAVALAAHALPGALLGATLNQYVADPAAVLRNLLPKLRAGARYVQTQPVFDLEQLRPLAEAVKNATPETAVVAMAMPLLSVDAAEKIAARLCIGAPPAVHGGGAAGGWAAFDDVLASLVSAPFVDGVAIMTFELDPPAETGARICQALRAAGVSPP